jgi:hypothetical protein
MLKNTFSKLISKKECPSPYSWGHLSQSTSKPIRTPE